MGTNVHLTPELERFAREVVAEGRYNNVSEVVRQGLRMLQEAEERKKRFMRRWTTLSSRRSVTDRSRVRMRSRRWTASSTNSNGA